MKKRQSTHGNRRLRFLRALIQFAFAAAVACGVALSYELPDGASTCPAQQVRSMPGGGDTVAYLENGGSVKVRAINGEWYRVRLPGGAEGYVHSACLDVTVWADVLDTGAWIHQSPSPASKVIGRFGGLPLTRVTDKQNNWYLVEPSGGAAAGWVEESSLDAPDEFFSAWLALKRNPAPPQVAVSQPASPSSSYETDDDPWPPSSSPSAPSRHSGASELRSQIVSYAETFLGTPYVHGGASPAGFDCSGFTSYVFEHFGIKISRSSAAQASVGEYVATRSLLPGDIVLFTAGPGDTRINHVGIYIGAGNFIQSSSSPNGHYVRISPLFEGGYLRRYVSARRVVDD